MAHKRLVYMTKRCRKLSQVFKQQGAPVMDILFLCHLCDEASKQRLQFKPPVVVDSLTNKGCSR